MDGIPSRLLQEAAPEIALPLATIFNYSMQSGVLPDAWKSAKVTPIYKDGSVLEASNYRPISVLPVCLKVFEKIIHQQLYSYLTSNNLLSIYQSGFRPSHSTETALIDVTDYILDNTQKGLLTGVMFLDLKKAFDTVDIPLMLCRLEALGIKNTELLWFQNYLTDRKQKVSINGQVSDPLPINYGVPQGSVLGPLLFIVYINDLQHQIKHSKITLYADDTAIFFAAKDIKIIQKRLQEDLSLAHSWLGLSKLTLNTSKTKCMVFGSRQRLSHGNELKISIDNKQLEQVDSFKYLGVWFDSTLTWSTHVSNACSKISQRLGVIGRIRSCLPQETAKMLVQAMILPVFDYGDVVWSSCSNTLLDRLQRLHNRAGKLILKCPFRTASVEVRKQLHWTSIRDRQNFHICNMTYKCFNNLVPPYLQNSDYMHPKGCT